MFLIFSSNFAGTDIFPGLPLLRYPSSILPFSLPKAPFDPRTHPSRSFTHPVLFPRTLPRLFLRILPCTLPCTLHRLFLASSSSLALFPASFIRFHISPPTLPRLIISPLPVTTPVTLPTNTLHHPSSRDPSTTPTYPHQHSLASSFPRFPKPLPSSPQDISKNSPLNAPSPPLPSLLFTPIFRPPGNPFPPSKSPSHFLADYLNPKVTA